VNDIKIEIDFERLPTGIDPRIMRDLVKQEAGHAWQNFKNRHDRRKDAAIKRKQAKYMVGPAT
jgi:cation transport regulator ChaB